MVGANWVWNFIIGIAFCIGSVHTVCHGAQVAFFQARGWDGQPQRLEKNGRFTHVALNISTGWIHSHPIRGVEILRDLKILERSFGPVVELLVNPDAQVEVDPLSYKGLPFDSDYSWDDEAVYCSELVAKILGISPIPMRFDPDIWGPNYQILSGQPGISPDRLYEALTNRGFLNGEFL